MYADERSSCVIFLQQNPIPTNKPGVEPKRPGRPVNITSICKLQATSTNQIVVTWNADPARVSEQKVTQSDSLFVEFWPILLNYYATISVRLCRDRQCVVRVQNFCMSAYVVHQLNTAILLDRLKKSGQRHADHTRAISEHCVAILLIDLLIG